MPPNCTLAMRSPCDSYDSKIFPGTPKHTLASLLRDRIRNDRLPKRNTAVVGGHMTVEVNLEATSLKRRNNPLQQVFILKRATAETDAIQAIGFSCLPADFNDHGGKRVVKFRGHGTHWQFHSHLSDQMIYRGPHIDFPWTGRADLKRIALRDTFDRSHFKFDGRLSFIIHFMTQPYNRSDGIEQPPAGRCLDRVQSSWHHRSNDLNLFFRNHVPAGQAQRKWIFPERVAQITHRNSPGFTNRSITARQRDIAQVRAALIAR